MSEAAVLPAASETPEKTPVVFRGAGFELKTIKAVGLLTFVVLIGVWQLLANAGLINPLFLPSPSTILATTTELVQGKALWINIGASLRRIALGWTIGTFFGI